MYAGEEIMVLKKDQQLLKHGNHVVIKNVQSSCLMSQQDDFWVYAGHHGDFLLARPASFNNPNLEEKSKMILEKVL
jgi:hypothetical protein